MNNSINVNSIVGFTSSDELYLDSRNVAEMMDTRHDHLMRKIVGISTNLSSLKIGVGDYWMESTYKDKNNQGRKCYLITRKGIELIVQRSRKTPNLDNLIKRFGIGDTIVLTSRFEDSFGNDLSDILNVLNIDVEYQKQCLDYRLDFYIPSVNLVIEYDENHHNNITNKKQDEIRENEIKGLLNCEILRLDYKDTDATNVGLVLKKIKELGGL